MVMNTNFVTELFSLPIIHLMTLRFVLVTLGLGNTELNYKVDKSR